MFSLFMAIMCVLNLVVSYHCYKFHQTFWAWAFLGIGILEGVMSFL